MKTGKLLIVEDDTNLQTLLALVLRRSGINFDMVTTAEDALMMLTNAHYTVLVIDLALPQMDGWVLLETIRHTRGIKIIPCVAITDYHLTDLDTIVLEAGFAAYFRKPLDVNRFVRQLQNIFDGSAGK